MSPESHPGATLNLREIWFILPLLKRDRQFELKKLIRHIWLLDVMLKDVHNPIVQSCDESDPSEKIISFQP